MIRVRAVSLPVCHMALVVDQLEVTARLDGARRPQDDW